MISSTLYLRALLTACLASTALTGCAAASLGDGVGGQPDPGADPDKDPDKEPDKKPDKEPDKKPDEPDLGDSFDANNPSHYLWTLKVGSYYTLPVLAGTAQVQYARFAAGADPQSDAPVDMGTLQGPQTFAENIYWSDLSEGEFVFRTFRQEDSQPMTSCTKKMEAAQALGSHNEILNNGYPDIEAEGFTNPDQFETFLSQQPGVAMFVDRDCTTPDADNNPTELRSVLSWMAVTVEATPNPAIFDPATDAEPTGIDIPSS